MRYRRLGQSGLEVSIVGLGSWLTYGGSTEPSDAVACVRRAYEGGVTLFDTANEYQQGRAEQVLGQALRPLPRDGCVVATKVYFPTGDRPTQRGLSRKHVTEQAYASLRRLGLDHVDILQCHRYDDLTPLAETCRAMDDLIRSGAVLYWGTSEWTAEQLTAAVTLCRSSGWSVPVSNQSQYSALWRRIEQRVLPDSDTLGLGTLAWSPLAMGILTGKYRPGQPPPPGSRLAGADSTFLDRYLRPGVLAAVEASAKVADAAAIPLPQLALAWCLRRHEVSSVLVGASRLSQVDQNVAAGTLDPPPEVLAEFDDLLAPVATY
jgi:aryl-alcohol dehydrogenase-like predicted oxidoreductase